MPLLPLLTSIVTSVPNGGGAIVATTTPTTVISPYYGETKVVPGLTVEWTITTTGLRKVVTMKVRD